MPLRAKAALAVTTSLCFASCLPVELRYDGSSDASSNEDSAFDVRATGTDASGGGASGASGSWTDGMPVAAAGGGNGGAGGVTTAGGNGGGGVVTDASTDCASPGNLRTCLFSAGLVARYFLDEASSGQDPPSVFDSGPASLHLGIQYTPELTFAELQGNRGLHWWSVEGSGRAEAPLSAGAMTVLTATDGFTIELVLDMSASSSLNSRLIAIATGTNPGTLALTSNAADNLALYFNDLPSGAWTVQLGGRQVVHAVIDTRESNAAMRSVLYVGGVAMPSTQAGSLPLFAQLMLAASDVLVLGNRPGGQRSFSGTLFYAALYATALGEDSIMQNASLLATLDDSTD